MTRYFKEDGILYQEYYKSGKEFKRKYIDNKIHNNSEIERSIYYEWRYMRKRCQAKNNKCSRYYYKKGIKVCDEWDDIKTGFNNFYEWAISSGYQLGLSLDRIDSDKNYCPDNCRWLTTKENSRLAVCQQRVPKWEYMAFNKSENICVIFYKANDFTNYCGIDSRRVSDGCKNKGYIYKGWRFDRRAVNLDYYESQETIPLGSTLEDELPTEVRIIRLPINTDEDIVRSS